MDAGYDTGEGCYVAPGNNPFLYSVRIKDRTGIRSGFPDDSLHEIIICLFPETLLFFSIRPGFDLFLWCESETPII